MKQGGMYMSNDFNVSRRLSRENYSNSFREADLSYAKETKKTKIIDVVKQLGKSFDQKQQDEIELKYIGQHKEYFNIVNHIEDEYLKVALEYFKGRLKEIDIYTSRKVNSDNIIQGTNNDLKIAHG